jgi:hypothetical protein
MKQIRTAPLPDPGKLAKNLPRHLGEFILKACEKDPNKRFQTPDAARQWLADHTAVLHNGRAAARRTSGPCRRHPGEKGSGCRGHGQYHRGGRAEKTTA